MTDKEENKSPQSEAPTEGKEKKPETEVKEAPKTDVKLASASDSAKAMADKPADKPEKANVSGKKFDPKFKGKKGSDKRRGGRGGRGPEEREFDQKTLDIARVTRVTKGGKRMRFRALVVQGNHKGRVGYGIAKGADVAISVNKAGGRAKKTMIDVPFKNDTIPHEVRAKYAAARVMLKPAVRGSGIKAGGAVRAVLEVAGIPNVTGKIMGSKNKINNVKATFKALESLIKVDGEKKETKNPTNKPASRQGGPTPVGKEALQNK
jgi:small subunit ribosomal protein S5